MFREIKDEEIKEIETSIDFNFINTSKKALSMEGFQKIFKINYAIKPPLSRVNGWLKYYDINEMESICQTAYEYRNYFRKKWDHLWYMRAIRFLTCIQAGLSRFDAYLDAHHQNDLVQEYKDYKDSNVKKKIMNLAASYSNNKMVITLAQALDAPIQISYQGYKHQMVEVLRDIAVNGKSERERANAANSLLQHLNPNQLSTLQINIGGEKKEATFIDQAQEALRLLARKKLEDIRSGTKAEDIINVDIIETSKELEEKQEEIEEMSEEEQKIYQELEEQNLINTEEQDEHR